MFFVVSNLLTLLLIGLNVAAEEPYQCNELYEYDAAIEGEITSPFYGKRNYPDNLWCEYRITAPEHYRIKLTFLDMDIDPSTSCKRDKLEVLGKDKTSWLGVFCGNSLPRPLVSHEDENEIRLVFQSDFMVSGRGFRLKYESGPDVELCGKEDGICRNRNCYHENKVCDGVDDCGDGTDEEECGKPLSPPNDDCGRPPIKPRTIYGSPDRIVGGEAALPNSWPWQVSIQKAHIEPNGHFCGGTLVNNQWVVTAAHCFKNNPYPTSVRIVIGSHYKYSKTKFEVTRVAEKIISYPDLEGDELRKATDKHDIALIKLNAPLIFNDGIQVPCLPHVGWVARHGWRCYTTGWGETRGTGFTDELKQAVQEVQSSQNCTHDSDTQVCVDEDYHSPCIGDRGGPLVCKLAGQWYLMGVTSFNTVDNYMGGLCAMPEAKVVFANVAHKGNWIRETINKNS